MSITGSLSRVAAFFVCICLFPVNETMNSYIFLRSVPSSALSRCQIYSAIIFLFFSYRICTLSIIFAIFTISITMTQNITHEPFSFRNPMNCSIRPMVYTYFLLLLLLVIFSQRFVSISILFS